MKWWVYLGTITLWAVEVVCHDVMEVCNNVMGVFYDIMELCGNVINDEDI